MNDLITPQLKDEDLEVCRTAVPEMDKAQILEHVWAYDFGGEGNVVESYVSYLRRKVDTSEPRLLHTVRGVGYVLRVPPG